ncbi:hypothetical protein [Roseibium aquae]|nr:hypothetical protein [Roseibium aquae]
MAILVKLIPLIGLSASFTASEIGFFAVQKQLESEERTGWLASENRAMLLTFGLFALFTVSFFGTFMAAMSLPFSPMTDVAIGLAAVTAATLAAYGIFGFATKRTSAKAVRAIAGK